MNKELKIVFGVVSLSMVISVFRNHMVLKYPYGTRAKERFRVRGQLFERKKVRFLRFVQGFEDESRIHPVQEQTLWKTEIAEKDPYGNCNRARILSTAAGVSFVA